MDENKQDTLPAKVELPRHGPSNIIEKASTIKQNIRVDSRNMLDTARLSLELTSIGIAVSYIENIKLLNEKVGDIEERLLKASDEMDIASLNDLYSKMTARMDNYLTFIRSIVKEANWPDIETRLNTLQVNMSAKVEKSNEELTEIAQHMVEKLRMINGQPPLKVEITQDDNID